MALKSTNLTYDMPSNFTKLDVSDKIAQYDSDATPLLQLTTKLNKKKATNTTIRWWEDDLVQRWALVGDTAASTAGTALTMATSGNADLCEPGGAVGTVLYNPATGEQVLCTSLAAATVLTITRDYTDAGTLGDTIAADSALLRIGTVDYENRLSHTPLLVKPVEKTNFTEIFRDPITFSGSQLAEMHYTGDDRKQQIAKVGRQHAIDIEQTFFLGQKKAGAASTARAMGGIKEYMSTTNQTSLSSGLSETNFETWMTSVFRFTPNGGRNLFVFGGGNFMQAINKISRDNLQTVSGSDNPYGVRFTRWISAQGDIRLIRHWLMSASPIGTAANNSQLARLAYAVNMDLVQYRPLAGRDTTLRLNIQENDRDGEKHEYLTEGSLEFKLPKAHGTLTDSAAFI